MAQQGVDHEAELAAENDAAAQAGVAAAGPSGRDGGGGAAAEDLAAELAAIRHRGRGQYGCRHYRRRVRFITPCW
jgi:hypothetical protein